MNDFAFYWSCKVIAGLIVAAIVVTVKERYRRNKDESH
jgi:hypothetical protein